MRIAGSASWLLDETDSHLLRPALFARDALGLTIPIERDVPPPLTGPVARRDGLLSADQRSAASGQWLPWWRQILTHVAQESVPRRAVGDPNHELLRSVAMERRDFFDPPDFAALAGTPELRLAVSATYRDGVKWFRRLEPEPLPAGEHYGTEPLSEHATPGGFRWTVIRDAAESVASGRGVSIGDVRAVTRVIEVDGLWSYLIAPGCGICSTSVAVSAEHAARYLRELFSSPLNVS